MQRMGDILVFDDDSSPPDPSGTADRHSAAQLTPLGQVKLAPVLRNVQVKETQLRRSP